MDQRIINLYDEYTHKALNRQEFLKRLTMYDGVNHAFHNDTNAARYNKAAAKLAWKEPWNF